MRLAPLPAAPSLTLPPPTEAARQQLTQWVQGLLSPDPALSRPILLQAKGAASTLVSAARERLDWLADHRDKQAMKELLQRTLDRARRPAAANEDGATFDYLSALISNPQPGDPAWGDLSEVLALTNLLEHIGSVEAARQIVHAYVRFGEFLRKDLQRQLQQMETPGSAALIEATRHKADKIGDWAQKQLEVTGRDNASDLVQNVDQAGLGDLLRAYGRTGDPEVARLVVSFANSDKRSIRQAAREGIVLLGEAAHWQLRDAYANLVADKPAREWTWDRTARELFAALDRARLADVYLLFDQGQQARQAGDLDQMRQHFDQLLIRSPLFDEREELAQGYFEYAKLHLRDAAPDARMALQRTVRLTEQETVKQQADSLLLTLAADELLAQGIADQVLYRRALQLDANNSHARERLEEIEAQTTLAQARLQRYVGAAVIVLATLVMGLYFLLTRRQNRRTPELAEAPKALPPAASSGEPRER